MPKLDEQYVAKIIAHHLQHPETSTDAYVGTPEKADRILNPDLAGGRLAERAQARLTDDQ